MKDAKLSAILGRDVNVGYVPTAEEMLTILAAVPNPTETTPENNAAATTTVATTEAPTQPVAEAQANPTQEVDLQATVTAAVTAALNPVTAQLADFSTRLGVIENSAGSTATTTPKVEGSAANNEKSWESPENSTNKLAKSMIGQ